MSRQALRTLVFMLAAAVVAQLESPLFAQAPAVDGPLSLDELLKLWKEREEQVRTLHVEFLGTLMVARGSLPSQTQAKPGQEFPPEDKTLEFTGTVWLTDRGWRSDVIGPHWHPPVADFVDTSCVNLFDGERYLTGLLTKQKADRVFPHAAAFSYDPQKPRENGWAIAQWPWLINYRNSVPAFDGVQTAKWRAARETAVIDGRDCYAVYNFHRAEKYPGEHLRVWVAPSLGHRAVRYEVVGDTPLRGSHRIDVQYRNDPEHGWLPTDWRQTVASRIRIDDDSLRISESRTFTAQSIRINQPLDDDPLQIELPPGTWFDDFTRGATVQKNIVREDGSERPIQKAELARGATYSDLVRTPSGDAGRPVHRESPNWLLWGSLAILLIALGGYFLRRSG